MALISVKTYDVAYHISRILEDIDETGTFH